MRAKHCAGCDKWTGHRRVFGLGTVIALLLTVGWWLFLMPFYPKRCVQCGQTAAGAVLSTVALLLLLAGVAGASTGHVWARTGSVPGDHGHIICFWRCEGASHGGVHFATTDALGVCPLP